MSILTETLNTVRDTDGGAFLMEKEKLADVSQEQLMDFQQELWTLALKQDKATFTRHQDDGVLIQWRKRPHV